MCGHPVPGRRSTCSPRCRVAQWRRTRERAHAATIVQLQGENQLLRQYVAELQHLVGKLKAHGMRR
jgi:hypothetical protein